MVVIDETHDTIETPGACQETTEYDNRINEEFEIEPEEQDLGVYEAPRNWEDIEQKFTRFERNYRARRIRELTMSPLAPVRKKRGPKRTRTAREAAI